MSEIETDVNLRVSALSNEFITAGDPMDSGRANGCIKMNISIVGMLMENFIH